MATTTPEATTPRATTPEAGDRLPTATSRSLYEAIGGRWGHVRDETLELGDAEAFAPPVDELSIEDYRARVADQVLLMAATGQPRQGFPVDQGGTGDLGGTITAFEMLGHADLSLMVKAGVHWGLFGGAVSNLGTERHHDEYMARIISAELPGCFAMTETGHGSDVQSLLTTATHDPETDELVVHTPGIMARKDYIGGAARDAQLAAVFAQLVTADGESHGVHCVLVPIRNARGRTLPGVTIEDCGAKAGLRGVDNGRLWFDEVRVPRTNLLNRYGDIDHDGAYTSPIENQTRRFFTMLGTLVRGRVSVAAGAGAATRTALAIATTYAGHRRQFGAPGTDEEVVLMDYRVHQRKLLPAIAKSYALKFAQNELVARMHDVQAVGGGSSDHDQRELEARAAGIKAVTTAHATATIQLCRESCGGAGYLATNRLPALKADSDVFTTFEGDNTVLLQLVAKGLLTDYRDAFGDLDTIGMAGFVARQFAGAVIERTAARAVVARLLDAAPGSDQETSLLARTTHLSMIEDREKHIIEGVAMRMRRAAKPGADLFAVFNEAQDHVIAAASAHVDRVVLEAFVAGIDACEDPAAREVLEMLCDLHALTTIEAHRGWFLEHNRLTPGRSKAVTAAVNELCGRLRPHAQDLVDGFGIPHAWLGTELLAPLTEPAAATADALTA